MIQVTLEGWIEGFEKVSLTKLQVTKLGMSLRESKNNVDSLLDGKKVIFQINDTALAREFCDEAEKVGVICKMIIS